MPFSRMYLDVFLVGADILAQFTPIFQTFVNPLVVISQLLLRSRPELTFTAGQTLSLVDILIVQPESLPRFVVPVAALTPVLLLPPPLLHPPLGVRLGGASLLPLTAHPVFLQEVADQITLEGRAEVTERSLAVVENSIMNLVGVHQHSSSLLGRELAPVALVSDAQVLGLLMSRHVQTIFRPEVAALKLTPDHALIVRAVSSLSRLQFLPGILRTFLNLLELSVVRSGLAPSLFTSAPPPD